MKINEALLDEHLAAMESAHAWSPRVVSKLETELRSAEDHDVFRMNPIIFAEKKGIDEEESIALFLHGAKVGLFVMEWHLVCPLCSQYLASFSSLRHVHSDYYCATCHYHGEAALDDYIEITFTPDQNVRTLKYHHPETLTALEFVREFKWSKGAFYPDGTTFMDFLENVDVFTDYIEPGETKAHTVTIEEGRLMGSDVVGRIELDAMIDDKPTTETQKLEITLSDGGASQNTRQLSPGPCEIIVTNNQSVRAVVEIHNINPEQWKIVESLQTPKFLTGSRLLMTPTFRKLFSTETIDPTTGLGIKSVSILFTDLKGSTELYETIGDLEAFNVIQQHFERLGEVVRKNNGIIIKTIGDAVMASFPTPEKAVKASIEILNAIDKFNEEVKTGEVVLKLGIHSGASIAVTLNDRLDYFGQTVNIASRVQGLAHANEVCITDDVYNAHGVHELVDEMAHAAGGERLKGVKREHLVHRISLN